MLENENWARNLRNCSLFQGHLVTSNFSFTFCLFVFTVVLLEISTERKILWQAWEESNSSLPVFCCNRVTWKPQELQAWCEAEAEGGLDKAHWDWSSPAATCSLCHSSDLSWLRALVPPCLSGHRLPPEREVGTLPLSIKLPSGIQIADTY